MNDLVQRFRDAVGRDPDGVFSAPGRVNLIGEHTDHNEGHVLPFAIDRRCGVAAGRRSDEVVTVASAQTPDEPVTTTISALHDARGWSAYALGTIWALAEAGLAGPDGVAGGWDLVVGGDVPLGAGMSSSAALEGAVGLAVATLSGSTVDRLEIAAAGRRAENEVVGAPVGIMDQAASLLCREGAALLLDCRTLATDDVDLGLAAAGLTMVAIDSRVRHDNADGGYADRQSACAAAARSLGVRALRDATLEQVAALDDPVRRRARHVVTEQARVHETVALLRAGRPAALGPVLTASHASLRDDYEVSTVELDAAVSTAGDAGALGARLIGGGFGGSVLALVGRDDAERVVDAVVARFAREGWAEPVAREVSPSAGARQDR